MRNSMSATSPATSWRNGHLYIAEKINPTTVFLAELVASVVGETLRLVRCFGPTEIGPSRTHYVIEAKV
jgi:hypothetical protein